MKIQHDSKFNQKVSEATEAFWKAIDRSQTFMISFLSDESLTILWANDLFYQFSGYSEVEFQNRFQAFHVHLLENISAFTSLKAGLVSALERGEGSFDVTTRFPLKSNDELWLCITVDITDEKINGYTVCNAALTDVSDLMSKKEVWKHETEEKTRYFQWIMEKYVGPVYISDVDTYELLYINPIARQLFGHSQSELLGRKCYEVIQGLSSPCPFCTSKFLKEDQFYEWEFNNHKLNQTYQLKDRLIKWRGHRARLELAYDTYNSEYKLAKKDQERDAIIRTIPGGLVRVDARDMSTALWYGAGFLDLIGYTKEQFENELHSQCSYMYPEDLARARAMMENAKNSGEKCVFEGRVISRGGEIKFMTLTLSYVSGEDSWDGIPSFYSVGIDITKDRKEYARQSRALEDAYQAVRVASSAKTNFLSSMSHDIRTPMNAIMGMTAIAKANLESPEKVMACFKKIATSNQHLLSLINEVLDMSRIESGKIDLTSAHVSLSNLIQNVVDICRPLMEEKQQEFQISIGKVNHENVFADGERLQQILMNLLSNAIKYTPSGGKIALRINELFSAIPNQGQYEFICIDNGIGISSEFLPHIFEPFTRAEDPGISKLQGTGLGMAITENIVHMMNGTIDVQSELGKGSRFVVSVPLELDEKEESCSSELAGLPILIVDDDQITCESAAALLNELGMRGYWVLSGKEAVASVAAAHRREDDFFAIVLDWQMPEMNGLETVMELRKKIGAHIPIIIVSAYDYSDIKDDFLRAGADAFIAKPLFKSKLMHVLHQFVAVSEEASEEDLRIETANATLADKRVLIVEDNDINREIAVELLKIQDIHVDTVENGQRAVEIFTSSAIGEYDAILMDIQMPVMNGYNATIAIRKLDREDAKTIPILAMTANAFASDVGKARSAGMNDHIAKPIDPDHLFDTLRKWMI